MLRSVAKTSPALWPRSSRLPLKNYNYHARSYQSKSTTSSQIYSHISKSSFLWTIVGLGTASATGYFFFPASYTIHADVDLSVTGKSSGETFERFPQVAEKQPKGIPFQVPGTQRIDGFCLASNFPIEDGLVVQFHPFSDTLGYLWIGIFDGHNGTYTSELLSTNLASTVISFLADLYSMHAQINRTVDVSNGMVLSIEPGAPPDPVPSDEEIDEAIISGFCAMDDFAVHGAAQEVLGLDFASYAALQKNNSPDEPPAATAAAPAPHRTPPGMPLEQAVKKLEFAQSGSCALAGLFNTADRSLRVALTGDSHAVFGRRVPAPAAADGTPRYTYEARPLTAPQTAANPEEAARLAAQHPDEPALVKGGRVLGWGLTRAFGDGAMKWSRAVQARLHAEVFGDRPRDGCKTPPYFTAEPVVTMQRDVRRGDFAVFASDGLWDCLTSEEVVGLVGQWLEERGSTERVLGQDGKMYEVRTPNTRRESQPGYVPPPSPPFSPQPLTFGLMGQPHPLSKTYAPADLPVIYPETYKDDTVMYNYWRRDKKFVVKDDNVATHLTRNALGGADTDLREGLLAMHPKRARKYRDDISVVVVFFD